MATYYKDPDATLDYGFDWSEWLASGETISSSSWTIPTGLTEESSGFSGGIASVWLSGGTAGTNYEITNKITTSAGRTDERSHVIKVRER